MTRHTFHVTGIHCPACKMLIEDIVQEQPDVQSVSVNMGKELVTVETTEGNGSELIERWAAPLKEHGYTLSLNKQNVQGKRFHLSALLIGGLVLAGYFLLQKSGLVTASFSGDFSPWMAFLIGVVASLSSCLAVVGGLVLSLSAKVSQDVATPKPFVSFHIGRLVGFAGLGGLLGLLGEVLTLSATLSSVLGLLVALIMIVLGINLLGIAKIHIALPRGLFDRATKMEHGFLSPFLIGAATFFLPCGFTQSMQFAALSSGSFVSGTLIMLLFALGTLPVLALLSFGSFRFAHSKYAPVFFQTAGVIVVGFGLFSLLTGLAAMGIIPPIISL